MCIKLTLTVYYTLYLISERCIPKVQKTSSCCVYTTPVMYASYNSQVSIVISIKFIPFSIFNIKYLQGNYAILIIMNYNDMKLSSSYTIMICQQMYFISVPFFFFLGYICIQFCETSWREKSCFLLTVIPSPTSHFFSPSQ